MLIATLRNVLKGARDDGRIDTVPDTPRIRQKDNPRSFFRFPPLVPSDRDEFEALLSGAQPLTQDRVVIRGIEATEELYRLIVFAVSSFVRPTTTELYAPQAQRHHHRDRTKTAARDDARDGKTGFQVANSMPDAVAAYERIRYRYPDVGGEDYIFLPGYPNRAIAARII